MICLRSLRGAHDVRATALGRILDEVHRVDIDDHGDILGHSYIFVEGGEGAAEFGHLFAAAASVSRTVFTANRRRGAKKAG